MWCAHFFFLDKQSDWFIYMYVGNVERPDLNNKYISV